ncbi:MAG: hypothetical protein J2P53_18315 [Bradyrhizobiaceae bacterium]|nr:hypothetical protein [Bradyrhizobiaceae bacterium]
MNASLYEPPLHPSELQRSRVRSIARFMVFFLVGVTATLAWQTYGGRARERIAGWSPRLAWLVPPPPPGADQISRDLAAVRQTVDKLAADINRLPAPQPSAAASARKPAAPAR